ncbi:MAG: MBL fold metallo-hydrolase [Chloroflexi bacterium]|nr:MBL fold metallo-hydrolase [Chloroflexota bacterium]
MESGIYSFRVGDFNCVSISDGLQPIDAAMLPTFFAGASPEELAIALRQHGMSPDGFDLQCSPLLIDTGDERVLIDSGGGSVFHSHLGKVIPGLAAAGYQPRDIDIIVLTHGHLDHVCGGVDANGEMVFPRARQLMARGEWAYWTEETDAAAMGERFVDDVRFTQDCLRAMRAQVELIEPGDEVTPGIQTIATPGHTRDHISLAVASGERRLICAADTMDLPIHIERTDWHPDWDEQPETGMRSRRMLLRRALDENALIHAFHFPFPGVGYVRADGDGWRFEPLE